MKTKLIMTDKKYKIKLIAENEGEKYLIEAINEFLFATISAGKTTSGYSDKRNVLNIELESEGEIIKVLEKRGYTLLEPEESNGEINQKENQGVGSQ